ncbi:MAG TPA: hypothetical protein VLV16_14215 [Gemmatimonadales bacterium]|nr:hypothetical protein [Gemmatimonadales bacterium]
MRALLLLLLVVVPGGVAAGQGHKRANTRQGFWIGFGLGDGSAGLNCHSCSTDRVSAWSGYLRMGGTVSPSVLLGGETNGWLHSDSGVDESIGYASFVVLWYPSRQGALYLKFGVGGMSYRANDGTDELTATAPSVSLGIGYEFRTGRNFSVVPYFNALSSSSVSLRFNGSAVSTNEDISISLVQLGVGVNWH